jgi:hypothetical protein
MGESVSHIGKGLDVWVIWAVEAVEAVEVVEAFCGCKCTSCSKGPSNLSPCEGEAGSSWEGSLLYDKKLNGHNNTLCDRGWNKKPACGPWHEDPCQELCSQNPSDELHEESYGRGSVWCNTSSDLACEL